MGRHTYTFFIQALISALGLLLAFLSVYGFYEAFQYIHGCNIRFLFQTKDSWKNIMFIGYILGAFISFTLSLICTYHPWVYIHKKAYDYALGYASKRIFWAFIINPIVLQHILQPYL